jgi:hypothetical protein
MKASAYIVLKRFEHYLCIGIEAWDKGQICPEIATRGKK